LSAKKAYTASRPRLLFISASSGLYGAEQCLVETLKGLNGDYEISVLLPGNGPLKEKIESLGLSVIIADIKWVGGDGHVLAGIMGIPARVSKLMKIIEERRIDLIFSNSSVVVDGAIAAKIRKMPHIWHIHEGPINGVKGQLKRALRSLLVTMLSERVITVSKGAREFFSLFGGKKFCTIYNGVNVDSYRAVDAEAGGLREELGLSVGYPIVAMVGSLLENKGQMDLVEAARLIDSQGTKFYYLVVGTGNKEYIGRVRKKVDEYGLTQYFRFTGFRSDIPNILRNIDLFVLASRREPFGRVIAEAMACGRPVVATRSGGPEEIVVDRETGLFIPPGSPVDLARAIKDVLSLPDGGKGMGLRGKRVVEERFSLKEYQSRISDTIKGVLDRKTA